MRFGRLMKAFVTVALLLGSLAFASSPAVAVSCSTEEQLLTTFALGNFNATGSFNKNLVREANIDNLCQSSSHAMRASTAYVEALLGGNFLKIGWREVWRLVPPQHVWHAFAEVQVGGQLEITYITLAGYGNWAQFKVMNVGGQNWQTYYDGNSDDVYEWVEPFTIPNMTNGNAVAQTARRGNGSAYDHMVDLKYRGSDNIWRSWAGPKQRYDDISTYHCHKVTSTEYEVHTPNTGHSSGTNYCG